MKNNKVIFLDHGWFLFRSVFNWEKNRQIPYTYTYLRMLIANLKRVGVCKDDIVIIGLDQGKSWRTFYDKNYKAGRKEQRDKHDISWHRVWQEFDDLLQRLDLATNLHIIGVDHTEYDDIAALGVRYFKENECIIISPDHDMLELVQFENVKIWSPLAKYKCKKGKYVDSAKVNPYKELAKKIQCESSDGLTTVVLNDKDYNVRKKIVTLATLPQDVEGPILEAFKKINYDKKWDIRLLPYKSLRNQFMKIFDKDNIVTYEECINYVSKKRRKKK